MTLLEQQTEFELSYMPGGTTNLNSVGLSLMYVSIYCICTAVFLVSFKKCELKMSYFSMESLSRMYVD